MHDHINNVLFQAARFKSQACEAEYDAALQLKRPFILLKPRIFIDGDKWCCLYGDNLQDGVAGFGDTPELASIDFDIQWLNSRLPKILKPKGTP